MAHKGMAAEGVAGVLGNYRWFGAPGVPPLVACDHERCVSGSRSLFQHVVGGLPTPLDCFGVLLCLGPHQLGCGIRFLDQGDLEC